ncbi:MAG: hypothetical protein K6A74_09305 [Lachnospiraceae bacterium]|nr:hypothetical protein [Lachnospiraceae bacterium]
MEKETRKKLDRFTYFGLNIIAAQTIICLFFFIGGKFGIHYSRPVKIQSTVILFLVILISIVATMSIERNIKGIMLNSAIGVEAFLMALHFDDGVMTKILPIALGLIVLNLSGIFFCIFLKSEEADCKRSFRYRLGQFFIIGRSCMVVALPIVIVLIFYKSALNDNSGAIEEKEVVVRSETIDSESESTNLLIYGDEYSFKNNVKRMVPLAHEETWEIATIEEKKDALTAVIECELRYLGIPYKIKISFSDLERDTLKGWYSYGDKEIVINNAMLLYDDNVTNLRCGIHEARHVYQHCICDIYRSLSDSEKELLCFSGVAKWVEELETDVDSYENYDEYKERSIETDATYFSYTEASEYYEELLRYLGE